MSPARRPLRVIGILGAAALVASGCGGGDEAVAPVDAAATPTTTTPTTPGSTVGDPGTGATPAIDPSTGLPIDPAAAGAGATATVPELVGDDVAGGLGATGDAPLFDARAVEAADLVDTSKDTTETTETTSTETESVSYDGAKIYVDGITHTVDENETFPKGNPVFRLLSVTANDIEIELVAGEFTSSGGDGTYLDKGDMVSLVNASEQVTYRVKYVRPITSSTGITF